MVEKKPKDAVPISDVKKTDPPAKPEDEPKKDERIGRIVEFWIVNNFRELHFTGVFLGETETHYQFFDSRDKKNMDVLKTSVERVVWEGTP